MLVYRISSPKYIDDLSGAGAKQYGGRWNEKGTALVYFAGSRAMAVMEVLVHLRPENLDSEYILAVFEVPDYKVKTVEVKELPKDWKVEPAIEKIKELGNSFVKENEYLLMKVPSVLVEEEFNYVMNPNHDDAKSIKLISKRIFKFDVRFKN